MRTRIEFMLTTRIGIRRSYSGVSLDSSGDFCYGLNLTQHEW